jgi:hypothetical protein
MRPLPRIPPGPKPGDTILPVRCKVFASTVAFLQKFALEMPISDRAEAIAWLGNEAQLSTSEAGICAGMFVYLTLPICLVSIIDDDL